MLTIERSAEPAATAGKWFFAAAIAFGAVLVVLAVRHKSESTQAVVGEEGRSVEAYARIAQLTALLNAAANAETGSRGYVITGDAGFLTPLNRALAEEAAEMTALEALYAGDSERGPLVRNLRAALETQRAHMSTAVALRRSLGAGEATQLLAVFRGGELTDSVRDAITMLLIEEQSTLARERQVRKSATAAGTRKFLVAGGISVLLLTIAFVPRKES